MEAKPEELVPCRVADLLARVFFLPEEVVKRKLGLPVEESYCLNCNARIETGKEFCNQTCRHEYNLIPLICDVCGKTFKRRKSVVMANYGPMRYQHTFCNERCKGTYAGKHYGFAAHPENTGNHGGKRKGYKVPFKPRKGRDYRPLIALREKTRWGCIKLSRATGIPEDTISRILLKAKRGELDAYLRQ